MQPIILFVSSKVDLYIESRSKQHPNMGGLLQIRSFLHSSNRLPIDRSSSFLDQNSAAGHHSSCSVVSSCECRRSYHESMSYYWDIRGRMRALNP